MDIAIIIILSITLLAVLILGILFIRSKSSQGSSKEDFKEIIKLSHQLDDLSKDMKVEIKMSVSDEMIKFNNQSLKTNEANNEKLERFQKNITESLNTRFDALRGQIDTKLNEMNKKVDDKLKDGFTSTNEAMAQVRERLQAIDSAQKNIESLSKDVVSLKGVLEGNQSRGRYGEYQLSMVLHNVFGDTFGCYEEQYDLRRKFAGEPVRADAVVFMPEPNKMICIDSKFPFVDYEKCLDAKTEEEKQSYLSDFNLAVKKHITTIKDKYIIEGKTAKEALMFIPNDGVFAFIYHNSEEVVEYARRQNVILTSPSTLPAILITLNMIRIDYERNKNVKLISIELNKLGIDFKKFNEDWFKLSNQLDTVSKTRERLDNRVDKITTRFDSIADNNKNELENEEKAAIEIEENI